MSYETERKKQIQNEINWLKAKLQGNLSEKQRNTYENQIKKKEYDLALGIFPK